MVMQTGNCSTVELPGPLGPGRDSNPHLSLLDAITGMLRPAASFVLVAVVFVRSRTRDRTALSPDNRAAPARDEMDPVGVAPTMSSPRSIAGATTPTRGARAELLLRARASPGAARSGRSVVRERRLAPPPRALSGIPNLRFDQHVARNAGGGDPVAAVPDVERLAGTRQAHRRRLATLLEPHAVALDLRAVETTVTEADVRERDPGRCERRICDTPPFSRSSRVRTGGVEPPQPLATRLQRAELAGARRPQGETRRPVGFEPTLRGSRPRMLAVTSRPPREWKAGSAPRNRGQRRYRPVAPEPAVVPFGSPASVVATPPPPHRLALGACRPSCTLGPALCTALVPSLPDPPVGEPILSIARVGFEPTVSSS